MARPNHSASFTNSQGKTVVITPRDMGAGNKSEAEQIAARDAFKADLQASRNGDGKATERIAAIIDSAKARTSGASSKSEKAKPPMTLREEKAPDFLSPREQRRVKYAGKVKKVAKRIVDEIDKTPSFDGDKRFNIKFGKAGERDMATHAVYLYGRERSFNSQTGSMYGGGKQSQGLMIQSVEFKKSMQGLGVFNAVVSEYQSRYPNRGVFIEAVENKSWAKRLDQPDSGWQKTPDWTPFNKNYWKPPLVTDA